MRHVVLAGALGEELLPRLLKPRHVLHAEQPLEIPLNPRGVPQPHLPRVDRALAVPALPRLRW